MTLLTKKLWEELHLASPIFERQLLLFPVLVVFIVSTAFVLGGRCVAWQWWLAVGVVLVFPFALRDKSERACLHSDVLFIVFLVLVWLLSNVFLATGGHDQNIYHFPAIRMLTLGWNPITSATPDALLHDMGVDPTTIHQWHILSMPKAVWYFSAVAYYFTKSPFDLFMPIFLFVFAAAAFAVDDFFRTKRLAIRCLAIFILFSSSVSFDLAVDSVVGLAGVGLVLTMVSCIRRRTWDWWRLLSLSFWMCESKHLGLAACFVFWVIFAVVISMKRFEGGWRRLTLAAMVLTAATMLVGFSPYFTSWRHYGHPLYPAMSGNPAKYPTINLTRDFHERNDDARLMGRVGNIVNAYVSTTLAHAYYRRKTGRMDYLVSVGNWGNRRTPTSALFKFFFCLTCLLAVVLGDCASRMGAAMVAIGVSAFPTEMIGYVRYAPWLAVIYLLAFETVVDMRLRPLRLFSMAALSLYFLACGFAEKVVVGAYDIDAMWAATRMLKESPPKNLLMKYDENQHAGGCKRCKIGNVRLLQRQVPALASAVITNMPKESESDFDSGRLFFDYSFYCGNESRPEVWSRYRALRIERGNDRRRKMAAIPGFLLETYFVTLPRLLVAKGASFFSNERQANKLD